VLSYLPEERKTDVESPYSGVRAQTGRVKRWRGGPMALRWTASALLSIEKRMRWIMGCQ
jgi:hypothetical protein